MNYQQWVDWVSTNSVATPISRANYNAYLNRAREGDLRSGDPGFGGTRPAGDVQQNVDLRTHGQYQNRGGNLSYSEWTAQGRPEPHQETGIHVNGDGDDTFNLSDAIAQYQQQIRDLEAQKSAEAQRLSARGIGHTSRQVRNALLATGRTGGEIEQLSAAGIEGGARSLNDLLQQLSLQSQTAQAGAAQFGIGANLTQEEINARLLGLSQQQGQFSQGLSETMRQFDLSRKDQRRREGFFGSQGLLSSALGNIGFGFNVG